MTNRVSRRTAIGAGATVAATAAALTVSSRAGAAPVAEAVQAAPAAVPGAVPAAPAVETNGPNRVRRVYERQKGRAGGRWHSHIALLNPDGTATEVLADDADFVLHGYSVQKLYVAMAVLDKIDRGQLTLDTLTPLTADIIAGGSGIYRRRARCTTC
jgi:beta-lactamase class A